MFRVLFEPTVWQQRRQVFRRHRWQSSVNILQVGERIDAAVNTLSAEQREVFALRMYGNTPFKEIAKIQKCSINTCLARMQYALGNLRSILKDEYEEIRETMS